MDPVTQLADLGAQARQLVASIQEAADRFRPEPDEPAEGPTIESARQLLDGMLTDIEQAAAVVRGMAAAAEQAAVAKRERIRFTPEGVAATIVDIERLAARRAPMATARLLSEVAAALIVLEVGSAASLVAAAPASLVVPDGIGAAMTGWNEGDLTAGRQAVAALLSLGREQRVPSEAIRRLALLAAWLAFRTGDPVAAVEVLDHMEDEWLGDAGLHAERAGLSLALGESGAAAEHARRAIELDPGNGFITLQLGATSEANGDYRDAVELYQEGCGRLDRRELSRVGQGVTFLQPSGLLHLARAERLEALGDLDGALAAVDFALLARIAGDGPNPEVRAYELRYQLLQRRQAPMGEVARAALEAGRRNLLDDNALDRAIGQLRVAVQGGPDAADAGWYLAHALWLSALAGGDASPDVALAREARQAWDDWRAQVGPPARASAWAYVSRARIADVVRLAERGPVGPMAWEATLLCERSLVLNPLDGFAWGMSARYLHFVKLEALALESADAGFAVNPDETSVHEERVALLNNAGRYEEALETLARMPGVDTDPWLSGVRAWGLLRQGKAIEAVRYLDLPLSGSVELGWYLDLRVACYVALRRLDDAVSDLRRILEVDFDMGGQSAIRRCWARAALGEPEAARTELDQAREDETVDEYYMLTVTACVSLAEGDVGGAGHLVEQALAASTNAEEADETVRTVRNTHTLLVHTGHPCAGGDETLRLAEEARSRWQPGPDVSSAEWELWRAVADRQGQDRASDAMVALAAINARRLRRAGCLEDASSAYDGLSGGPFEPEATLALGDVLAERCNLAIAASDVEQTRALFGRLDALGKAPASFVEIVVADALRAGGHPAEAVEVLSAVVPLAVEPADRLAVQQRLGDSALIAGSRALAAESFAAALAAATELHEHLRAAQLEVGLAVVASLDGRTEAAAGHLLESVRRWIEAGTLDPLSVLEHELQWLIEAAPEAAPTLAEALDLASRTPGSGGAG